MLKTLTVDDVVATMDSKDAGVAFDWHSTCISGFVYTRFALWLAVICPLSMDYAMMRIRILIDPDADPELF